MKAHFTLTVRESPIGDIDVEYDVEAEGDEIIRVIEKLVEAYPDMMAKTIERIKALDE